MSKKLYDRAWHKGYSCGVAAAIKQLKSLAKKKRVRS
jgi:hypothetical protein